MIFGIMWYNLGTNKLKHGTKVCGIFNKNSKKSHPPPPPDPTLLELIILPAFLLLTIIAWVVLPSSAILPRGLPGDLPEPLALLPTLAMQPQSVPLLLLLLLPLLASAMLTSGGWEDLETLHHLDSRNSFEAMVTDRLLPTIDADRMEFVQADVKLAEMYKAGITCSSRAQTFKSLAQRVVNRHAWLFPRLQLTLNFKLKPQSPIASGVMYQADLFLQLKQDITLTALFHRLMRNQTEDVKSVGLCDLSFHEITVRKGECVYFEIAESPDELFNKTFQLARIYEMRRQFLGEKTKICATGIIMNGGKSQFTETSLVAKEFFETFLVDADPVVEVGLRDVPFFLCYSPQRSVFSTIEDLRDELQTEIKELKSEVKEMKAEIKQELKAEVKEMKAEIKQELKAEIKKKMKSGMKKMKSELKQELTSFKSEIKGDVSEIKGDISEIKALLKPATGGA